MRRNSSDRERPILVIPRQAKIEIPDAAADSSSASFSGTSITIHASAGTEDRDKVRATGKRRGEAAEAAFLARATGLGFGVLLPWGESDSYDAAVDSRRRRRLQRVQVKSAAAYNSGYTIKTTGANGRVYTLDDIDFVVGYVVPEDIWYIIPVEALGKRATIKFRPHSRRLVKPMFERYREAWCLLDCPRERRGRNDIPKTCRSEELGVRGVPQGVRIAVNRTRPVLAIRQLKRKNIRWSIVSREALSPEFSRPPKRQGSATPQVVRYFESYTGFPANPSCVILSSFKSTKPFAHLSQWPLALQIDSGALPI